MLRQDRSSQVSLSQDRLSQNKSSKDRSSQDRSGQVHLRMEFDSGVGPTCLIRQLRLQSKLEVSSLVLKFGIAKLSPNSSSTGLS